MSINFPVERSCGSRGATYYFDGSENVSRAGKTSPIVRKVWGGIEFLSASVIIRSRVSLGERTSRETSINLCIRNGWWLKAAPRNRASCEGANK